MSTPTSYLDTFIRSGESAGGCSPPLANGAPGDPAAGVWRLSPHETKPAAAIARYTWGGATMRSFKFSLEVSIGEHVQALALGLLCGLAVFVPLAKALNSCSRAPARHVGTDRDVRDLGPHWLAHPLPMLIVYGLTELGESPMQCVHYDWVIDIAGDVVKAPPTSCAPLPGAGW